MNRKASPDDAQAAYQKVLKVKKAQESRLMARSNVVGVGVGKSGEEYVLVVLVSQITARVEESLPDEIEGVKVEIRVIGRPSAQQD